MKYCWPLSSAPSFPDYPGQFGSKRKHDFHTGVDLYCSVGTEVFSMEEGQVISIETFTGPNANPPSPWWNETFSILIIGRTGVIVYGECSPEVSVGDFVQAGQKIGNISTPVLKKNKGRPTAMLHLELLDYTAKESSPAWTDESNKPKLLLDPTDILLLAMSQTKVTSLLIDENLILDPGFENESF